MRLSSDEKGRVGPVRGTLAAAPIRRKGSFAAATPELVKMPQAGRRRAVTIGDDGRRIRRFPMRAARGAAGRAGAPIEN
jgi:hypothetical protein